MARGRSKTLPDRPCEICSTEFHPYGKTDKYCSKECAAEAQRRKLSRVEADALLDADAVLASLKENSEQVGEMGCWLWKGELRTDGYPAQNPRPHRLACILGSGGKLLGSQPAHHRCGVRSCVNPEHIVPVTHAENIAEMLARGYFIKRVRELECALREVTPQHPLLKEIGVPEYDNLVNRKK